MNGGVVEVGDGSATPTPSTVVVTFECHVDHDAAVLDDPRKVAAWIGDLLNDNGIGYRLIGEARITGGES